MTSSPALFPTVTVTVVRDRKIRTARWTNQIAGFVTVPSWKKIILIYLTWANKQRQNHLFSMPHAVYCSFKMSSLQHKKKPISVSFSLQFLSSYLVKIMSSSRRLTKARVNLIGVATCTSSCFIQEQMRSDRVHSSYTSGCPSKVIFRCGIQFPSG